MSKPSWTVEAGLTKMNPRKRLASVPEHNNAKKIKMDSAECYGNAIKMEMYIYINSLLESDVPWEMIELIWSFGEGSWVPCCKCKEPTDQDYSTKLFSLYDKINRRCRQCDEKMQKWEEERYEEIRKRFPF